MMDEDGNQKKERKKSNGNKVKFITVIGREFTGISMKVLVNNKVDKLLKTCRRVTWLLTVIENYLIMKTEIDDQLGCRLMAFLHNPVELLEFEFQNCSRIARSALPTKVDGVLLPYLSSIPNIIDVDLYPLENDLNKTPEAITDNPMHLETNKHFLIFGTHDDQGSNIIRNRMMNSREPVSIEKKELYAVWIGPCTSGYYREYRLKLTNLYRPFVMDVIDNPNKLIFAEAAVFAEQCSFAETFGGTINQLLRSITSANAQFILAAAVSPYQDLNRFLEYNLTSFEEWTHEFHRHQFQMKPGKAYIVRMGNRSEGLWRNPYCEERVQKRRRVFENCILNLETSFEAQRQIITCFHFLYKTREHCSYLGDFVSDFYEIIEGGFGIAQLLERTYQYCGQCPSIYINFFAVAIDFDQPNVHQAKVRCMLIKYITSTSFLYVHTRTAYIDNFVFECRKMAQEDSAESEKYRRIINTVKRNGNYIHRMYRSLSQQDKDAILAYF